MKWSFHLPLAITLLIAGVASAQSEAEKVEDGNHLAAVLRAGRSVVSNNQPLINDETKGDKGLTPEVFMVEVTEAYIAAVGKPPLTDDLDPLQRKLAEAQLSAMAEIVAEQQTLINTPGLGFKGFIPATFGRLVNERFGEKVGDLAAMKATAPKEIVRNRKALPDEWEDRVINEKFLTDGWIKGEPWYETVDGEFRMLIPEYYSASCLTCHGEPKGDVDVTGFPKEGGQEGDLGGAISITLRE